MMIPAIIIIKHQPHNGICNSDEWLVLNNNVCSNSSFITLTPKCVHKKTTYLSKWFSCFSVGVAYPTSQSYF